MFKYKDYILYSVRAKLLTQTINNHLGVFWLVLDPVLRLLIYYVVFVVFLQRRTENFTSYLLVGILAFTWFSKNVTQSSTSIASASGVMRQVNLPKLIFPTIISFVKLVEFLIAFGLLLIFFIIRGQVEVTWLALPVIIGVHFIFNYSVGVTVAGIVPFIPDLSHLISNLLTGVFFLSGVFYEVTPEHPQYELFMLNPMAKILEQYRYIILYGYWPDLQSLGMIAGISFIATVIMTLVIQQLDYCYPRMGR
jgi:lipopolysaccharide transport system permease protein